MSACSFFYKPIFCVRGVKAKGGASVGGCVDWMNETILLQDCAVHGD